MRIIDNRYKIDVSIKETLSGTIYLVTDLWDNDKKHFLKFYDYEKHTEVVDYFINEYFTLATIKHNNLLSSEEFNIVKSIDRKKVNVNQYYYVTEYIAAPTLEEVVHKLPLNDRLFIILQLCTILDFLHFRGVVYKYLTPKNIYVMDNCQIKIKDLATIQDNIINNDFDEIDRYFIAPEVLLKLNNIDKIADFYSLGMIIKYLFQNNIENLFVEDLEKNNIYDLSNDQIIFLNNRVNDFIKKNVSNRKGDLKELILNLNRYFSLDYNIDYKKEREKLNFKTKIVGREEEIGRVINIDKNLIENKFDINLLLIEGETGIGKTRFLNEIAYILEFKGRSIYQIDIKEKENISFKPITNILRQMIKNAPRSLIEKYGSEIVKIIPEIRFIGGIKPSSNLSEEKEKLRMYDRISNFIKDLAKIRPIYIIIDNIHNADEDTQKLINYILQSLEDIPLLMIFSYNEDNLASQELARISVENWRKKDNVKEIKLSKLGLYEIGGMVKNILGVDNCPLKFSAVLLKETLGNPRYIELILQDIFATGELYVNDDGFWNLKDMTYSGIYMPSNLDETLKKQINLLEEQALEVINIISIFNGPVSKSVIFQMLNMDTDELNEIIEKLVSMKLLDERLSDWGYSYTFYNMQLKKLLYYEIDDKEKESLHKKASEVLEKLYSLENRENIEELIYHLNMSNQKDKAVDYLVEEAKKMQSILSSQAIFLWEKAYEISKDNKAELKLEILMNLGKLFIIRGENEKALKIYNEILEKSTELDKDEYIVISKNSIGEIYFRRNEIDKAFAIVLENKKLAEKINYTEGIIHSTLLLVKIYCLKDELEEALKEANKALNMALSENKENDIGYIYNQLGIIYFYKGEVDFSKSYFEKSIDSFEKTKNYMEIAKPFNNLGTIYFDFYGDDEKGFENYNKGLEICNKYGYIEMEMVFLNNIGETYIKEHDYIKAKEYIEKARNIALDMEDKSTYFLTNINLGEIYLNIGEYDNAFSCYYLLREEFEKSSSHPKEIVNQYYHFLGNFYFQFGIWDEALKYYKQTINICKEFNLTYYLLSLSRIIIINYIKNGFFDRESMEDLRERYRKVNLNSDREKVLTEFMIISVLNGKYEYTYDLLDEIESISDVKYVEFTDNMQKLVLFSINDKYSVESLLDLENKIKNSGNYEIDLFANSIIGDRYFKTKKYYQAINYYLEALDVMYRLVKKIPDREFQVSYIKSHKGDKIKEQINQIFKSLFDIEVKCFYIDDLTQMKADVENYFDFKQLFDLIEDEDFSKIIDSSLTNYYIKDINSIDDLIINFKDDYKYNLELILKYMAKLTIAQKGVVFYYNDEKGAVETIAKLKAQDNIKINEGIINLVDKRRNGVIIKNTFTNNKNNIYEELLPTDVKALICMPVISFENTMENKQNDRRKKAYRMGDKIVGYIYLETDRLFNRFDYERFVLIKSLSCLAFLNIENYNLKAISSIDKMTGVYTRKYFDLIFKDILDISKKKNEKFSLLMIDIDKFKNINDTYGHRKGDEVLSAIGETLMENTRMTDIVARYGGEEFIIVLLNTDKTEAYDVAEKLRKKIEGLDIKNINYPLTVSIGISLYPDHSQFKEELIEKADQALYCAKEMGRNKVALWGPDIANTLNRGDRLAGIISGNTAQDQRNVLAIMDIIDLLKKNLSKKEKIYEFLGRIIESVDAEYSVLILIDETGKKKEVFARKRYSVEWVDIPKYNEKIIEKAVKSQKGEFMIDWENIKNIDMVYGIPNWQSIIVIPLLQEGMVKGVVHLSVPIKEKEFDYNNYNLVNTICGVFAAMI